MTALTPEATTRDDEDAASGREQGKHTPGPWQVVPASKAQSPFIVGDKDGGSIADCAPCGPWMSDEEAHANAHLIAAAPDLLEALRVAEQCMTNLPYDERYQGARDKISAAISKATGA